MVVVNKELKVLMAAYNKKDDLLNFFYVVRDVQNMTSKELNEVMLQAFKLFIEEDDFVETLITCKYMFMRPEEKETEYTEWRGQGIGYIPCSSKFLSLIFKYEKGEITNIYGEND